MLCVRKRRCVYIGLKFNYKARHILMMWTKIDHGNSIFGSIESIGSSVDWWCSHWFDDSANEGKEKERLFSVLRTSFKSIKNYFSQFTDIALAIIMQSQTAQLSHCMHFKYRGRAIIWGFENLKSWLIEKGI